MNIQAVKTLIIFLLFMTLFSQSPALDNYVALEDTAFNYYAVDTPYETNYTNYIMYMLSFQDSKNL